MKRPAVILAAIPLLALAALVPLVCTGRRAPAEVRVEEGDDVVQPGETELVLAASPHAAESAPRTEQEPTVRRNDPAREDARATRRSSTVVLAEGRVVDAGGAPVGSGVVTLEIDRLAGWFDLFDVEIERDGRFAMPGELPGELLRLVAHHPDHAPSPPVAFEPGATGIVLVLGKGGRLAGSVRLLHPARARDFRVVARSRERPDDPDASHTDSLAADGSFELEGLPAGAYDLEVVFLRPRDVLARIEDVVVEPGQPALYPRLQGIALSGVDFVRVRVRLPDGRPARGYVFVLRPGEGRTKAAFREGVAVIPRFETPLELAVVEPGYLVVRLAGVVGDQEIVLAEPAIRVRLRLPASLALPRGPLTLELEPGSDHPYARDPIWVKATHTFRAREVDFEIQAPGPYALAFHASGSDRTIPASARLIVEALPAEQVFVVEPEPEAYARALERR